MTPRDPEQISALEPSLEDEGVPDLEGPLEGKRLTGDAQDGVPPPADRPGPGRDWGTTASEQRQDEPLRRRLLREEPDVMPLPHDGGVGRIVDPDSGTDVTREAIGMDAGEDHGGFSAEERAMREIEGEIEGEV
jgi:hypothetical protein